MEAAGVDVYLALGANCGARMAALQQGMRRLQQGGVEIRRCSRVYVGPYVGWGAPQPDYLNAVLAGRTHLSPLALLELQRAVEAAAGRPERTHMQPRTLDVDLLFYGGWSIRHRRLIVPHPRLAARRFVLEPLAELGVLDHWPGLRVCLEAARRRQRLVAYADLLVPGEARAAAPA